MIQNTSEEFLVFFLIPSALSIVLFSRDLHLKGLDDQYFISPEEENGEGPLEKFLIVRSLKNKDGTPKVTPFL